MAVRQINEYLESYETDDIRLSENITYSKVADPAYENMFLRIGPNGSTSFYRAPDQDLVWTDTDNTNIALTTTLTTVVAVTLTEDLLTTDGSYQLSGRLDNTGNQAQTVTIQSFENGVPTTDIRTIELEKDEVNRIISFSGIVTTDILSGTLVELRFSNSSNGTVQLRGDLFITTFTVTKAQAAPVAAITAQDVQDHDYKLNLTTTTNLGPKLSRTEIETVIVASGYPLPFDTVSFGISDPNRDFFVTYNVDKDKYVYVVLDEAT